MSHVLQLPGPCEDSRLFCDRVDLYFGNGPHGCHGNRYIHTIIETDSSSQRGKQRLTKQELNNITFTSI